MRNRASWQRVRAEIQAARSQGLCQDRVISYSDSQELPYLQACINEALRMFSPAVFGLSRVVPEGGITIGARRFEKDTVLTVHPK